MSSPARRPFTPTQEPPEALERRTVGRDRLLTTLAERLASAAGSQSRPHTLLVGPRGSGKTHVIRVALHRAGQDPALRDRLAFADLPEDVVGITGYADLLWEIGTSLGLRSARTPDVVPLETAILAHLGERTLVLVVENLDRVFRALGTPGQQDLRSWVETSGRVLILAAAPSIVAGVQDRNQPWFAGFITTPVDGLCADEGRELLTHLAREADDQALVQFLQTDIGGARVQAIAALTGGSPRIWMVLADCLTVESLDALVPAVEQLVEGLVPYFQQLLWDLPDHQQAIIRRLAEGDSAALTAADIAAGTGQSPQTVSKALQVLQEGRWVRAEKIPTDRRKTWYSLREPMLRHHFRWRAARGEPLALIVELLRGWYSPTELRRHLAGARPASPAESYLVRTLTAQAPDYDLAYSSRDPVELAAEARRWIVDGDDVFTRDCGRYVEACLARAAATNADAAAVLRRRPPESPTDPVVARALSAVSGNDMSDLLIAAASTPPASSTTAGLAVVAAGWVGHTDPHRARDLLQRVDITQVDSPATWFAVETDKNHWDAQSGRAREALTAMAALLPVLVADLGANHSITLTARNNIASYTGETGDPSTALTLYQALLPDLERALGPDHRDTLTTRSLIASYTGEAGDPTTALALFQALQPDLERILPSHDRVLGAARFWTAVLQQRLSGIDDALRTLAGGEDFGAEFIQLLAESTEPPTEPALLVNLWGALHGDAQAEVQLPSELREVIRQRASGR